MEAISNAIAEVKSAPRLKSERARATAAYEQDDDAAPSAVARTSVRGRSSGSSRCISFFETAAWTTPDSAKPRISAQRIAQSIPNENESASTISAQMSTPDDHLVLKRNPARRSAVVPLSRRRKGCQMLGLLIVIALALLLFGIVGGIAISKFLFLLLLVAAVIFLIGLFTRSTA